MKFNRILDTVLNEYDEQLSNNDDPLVTAIEITKQIDKIRLQLSDLERQLTNSTGRMNGDLALNVRKRHPGLSIGLDKNGCRVGYKSKSLIFNPDVNSKVWQIQSPDESFLRRFRRSFAPNTALSNDYGALAEAIATFFINHYKSLGEDIIGTGKILIEQKIANFQQLVDYRNKHKALME